MIRWDLFPHSSFRFRWYVRRADAACDELDFVDLANFCSQMCGDC